MCVVYARGFSIRDFQATSSGFHQRYRRMKVVRSNIGNAVFPATINTIATNSTSGSSRNGTKELLNTENPALLNALTVVNNANEYDVTFKSSSFDFTFEEVDAYDTRKTTLRILNTNA
mmetsp:Transcript_997/g.1450  ORF Transcript_997/g.1450 Transcript_997/m.1450 type:complete len:118 (-) Transcript_997:649-1002(-)